MVDINIVTLTGVNTPSDWSEATNVLRRILPSSNVDVGGTFALPSAPNGTVVSEAVPTIPTPEQYFAPQPTAMPVPTQQQVANGGGFVFAGQQQVNQTPPAPATPAPAQRSRYKGKCTDGRGKVNHKRIMFGDPADCACQPCVMGRNNPKPPVGQAYAEAAEWERQNYGFVVGERFPVAGTQQTPQPQTSVTPAQVANASQRMDALVNQAMPSVTPQTPVTPPTSQPTQQQGKVYPPLPQLAQSLTQSQGAALVEWLQRMVDEKKKSTLLSYLRGEATCDILRSVSDKKNTMYETAQRKVGNVDNQ